MAQAIDMVALREAGASVYNPHMDLWGVSARRLSVVRADNINTIGRNMMHDESAFPLQSNSLSYGMTLRDYFAAKAMQGMIANGSDVYPRIAEEAYQMADAMMEVRKND